MRRYQILGLAALLASAVACSDDDSSSDLPNDTEGDAGGSAEAGSRAAGTGGGRAGSGGAGTGAAGASGRSASPAGAGGTGAGAAGADAAGAAGTPAAGSGGAAGAAASGPKNIVETAVAAGSFTKLTAAVMKAGLVDALSGAGPLTVFAPTDAAFDAFEQANPGVLAALSNEELAAVLKYHVVGASVKAADLKNGQLAKTLQGPVVAVDLSGAAPKIGGATVTMADVEASNGVIHVIDKVLLPPKDIIEVATAAGTFGRLAAALTSADLVATLKGPGPFTVFAPTDAAFMKLTAAPTGAALKNVLQYHVVSGVAGPLDLKDKGVLNTVAGSPVLVDLSDGVKIGTAKVTTANVVASNGVIHVIDTVITPPEDDLVETAIAAGMFDDLAQALTAANLVTTLKGAGPFTVFAPTDTAFGMLSAVPTGDALANVLKYHVVMGAVGAGDLKAGSVDTLLTGKPLTIDLSAGVKVGGANVTMPNILTKNGVIHVVDKVLVPD